MSKKPEFREWQSIDTAPKDGTKVLVYDQESAGLSGRPGIGIAWWHSHRYHDKYRESWCPQESWCSQGCRDDVEIYHPTHWMPLPEAPEET